MKYYMKRHAVSFIVVLLAVFALYVVGNAVWVEDNLHVILNGVLRVGVGVSLILLVTKHGFPKIHIQDTITNEPIAVAIFAGALAIAIALLF